MIEAPLRLGFPVKVMGKPGLKSNDTRRWQKNPHLKTSLEYVAEILDYLAGHRIRMYRLSSDLAPYATHPDMPQFHDMVAESDAELRAIGAKAKDLDIPSVQELAKNEDDRKVIQLIISGDALGKPMATSPNVPADRVKALRDAFDATVRDPEFLKAAAAARIEVGPIPGVQLQDTVERVLATPKNLANRAKAIIAE